MDSLVVFLVCGVLAIPVLAIVALVRSGIARRAVDEGLRQQSDRIRDLERQLADLRRDFAQQKAAEAAPRVEPTAAPSLAREQAAPAAVRMEEKRPVPAPLAAPPIHASAEMKAPAVAPLIAPQAPVVSHTDTPVQKPAVSGVPHVAQPVSIHAAKEAKPVAATGATQKELPVPAVAASKPVAPPEPRFSYLSEKPPQEPAPAPTPPRPSGPPRKTIAERLRTSLPLEEFLGMNLFAKFGIILLVLGFALLGRMALVAMGPGPRVALIYAAGAAMLGGGIWLERRDRYRILGRGGIGGGWALLFFTTYAMNHVAAMEVIASNTLDCVLMLLVAGGMVGHTLRYKSQLVTGLAFLLAFSTVALSQDSVYSLVAGVILALGIVAIALRMAWWELEIFGILASFGNHFYWLYKLYPDGVAGHAFPQFWASTLILVLYWLVFRISYIARRIRTPRDESLSTVAALLNSVSLLVVMKFQSTRPELAFYALMALGLIEFLFGQLPVTRRRRPAFILLTVLGTILVFASVPFKFSGNNIALLWMIAAEVLLIAGIVQAEVLFRRLGLLGGIFTGSLVLFEAWHLVDLRQTSQASQPRDGVLLLAAAVLFYINAHFIGRKWKALFTGLDATFTMVESYLGGATAFLAVWALMTSDWTAVGWAALMALAAFGKRRLGDDHLLVQGWAFCVSALTAAWIENLHLAQTYPHHVTARLVTLPLLAVAFYATAWISSGADDMREVLRRATLWAGTATLAALVWTDVSHTWVALAWAALAAAISLIGRKLRIPDFNHQEHTLAVASVALLFGVNVDAGTAVQRYVPMLGSAVIFYAISRFCTPADASYRRQAAWLHTCGATALLASLAWHESSQLWLTAIWAIFALSLAVTDRVFDVEELPYQAHVLAALAVMRAATLNLYSTDKWRGLDVRLVTVCILVAVLYALARWVRLPESLRATDARHAYSWVASGLFAWMLWGELQPVSVALGLAVFGLLLFEFGHWRSQQQIRLQAYVAFCAAFIRIFFVNLTAVRLPGETISPRVYTVAPIALIYFFVWAQLQTRKTTGTARSWSPSDLIAYLGTACLSALVYFELPAEWIVFAWAVMVVLLLLASLLLDKEIFVHHADLLCAAIVTRGMVHNIFSGSYFVSGGWRGNLTVLSLTSALLLLALPIAFRLRARYAALPSEPALVRVLALRRPEQILFFAPVLLIAFMIAVKLNPGMVTLSWGVEGVMVIVLGLLAGQRSYRLTGLALLLLCVGKIVVRDAWTLQERDRYITFIALGGALTLVSTLYGRFREQLRRLL
ncbi:MAG TPA: DUF2339 domain-containing protein [Terracidiphilus sp.]